MQYTESKCGSSLRDPAPAASGPSGRLGRGRRRRRGTVVALALSIAAFVTANGCAKHWLARAIVLGPNTCRAVDPDADPDASALQRLAVTRQLRVDVGGAESGVPPASLSAWLIDPPDDAPPRATVLVLHGITDRKDSMLGFAQALAGHGYRAVAVDLRSHGRSTGGYITFGVFESRDLSELLDRLDAEGLLAGDVGVVGPSYGGSVGIQLAAADPRVKAAVAVCPFTSLRDVTPGVTRLYVPLGLGRLFSDRTIDGAVDEAGRVARFDPDDASPLRAISKTSAHVLLIHAADDVKIPPEHSRRLHAAAAPGRSRLLIVEGTDHDSVMAGTGYQRVEAETAAWFGRWLSPGQ